MKRTFHPDLHETLTRYEQRISHYGQLAARAARWRGRANRFGQWPRLLWYAAGGPLTRFALNLVADTAESDYLEAVMDWDNPMHGEIM